MSSARPFLTPAAIRAAVTEDLAVIDAALDRLRSSSTELVGNGFRVQMAERLVVTAQEGAPLSRRTVGTAR